ncbi:threonine synthase [Megalodesulfovibrio gigas]|uniref:Threonine synthase n=1 Tax=Megalodesulfovibrio gigas (strain ATCC 19364 / DSM 1382 / NCIMB 9332 / VKM B-1759) TaxID=1121448 RepID=T2GFB4_MEGG1|nr:threonine synthase [Megalodesulfovibrio gigas]AGW14874.1 putative threonine synthase [Megalodesulfovibrio gigas DSM 1382 = ATCC 19364]
MYFSSDFYMFPAYRGRMQYRCLGCGNVYGVDELLYTCPACSNVFILEDTTFDSLQETPGQDWRDLFDARAATKRPELRGIFRYYELMAPILEEGDIVCLGEGITPVVPANAELTALVGQPLAFKHDGQNPSASFKDRGMACAFSVLKHLVRINNWDEVLTICASTGDTSAAAALYAAYVGEPLKSVVLLPQGKVTPQQIAQPLGSGAIVLEIPGVFDDCMKVVEHLAERYRVALLNSKNAWRILGQESYAFEVAQWRDWNMANTAVFVPIGNAGNITAVMAGFLKMHRLGMIEHLPRIVGVQSHHADPVYKYYAQAPEAREYKAVSVQPSVAQAAMIGNPVSFPRVKYFQEQYEKAAGSGSFQVVQVTEQGIIEGMLRANRHGHIVCTQGGECLAGLIEAKARGILEDGELAILDATAHALKFIDFQRMYFEDSFPGDYRIFPRKALQNLPELVIDAARKQALSPEQFTQEAAQAVVERLELRERD